MKATTLDILKRILDMDETISQKNAEEILFACTQAGSQKSKTRHLIEVKEAMKILGVSRLTLKEYVKNGYISQNSLSPRKIRFDEENIRYFGETGAQ